MLKDIHDLGLLGRQGRIVNHHSAHHLVDVPDSTIKAIGLDKVGHVVAFLLTRLLVKGNKGKLGLVPLVVLLAVTEEDFMERAFLDALDLEVTCDIGLQLFCGRFLGFGAAYGIDYIGLADLFL